MANNSDNFYSQSALIKLEDGKEYRKRLFTETQNVLASLLDVLPSVYTATTPSTNYGTHLKRVAIEIARLKLEAENVQKDISIDTVRSQYLYQKFGYQIQVNNTFFPTSQFSDTDYRNFLKAALFVIFNGSTLANIKYALELVTKIPIEVRDTTSSRGVIQYKYIDTFQNDILTLKGTGENLLNIKLTSTDGSQFYSQGVHYRDASESVTSLVTLKLLGDQAVLQNAQQVLVAYDYRDALVDQFGIKVAFNLSALDPSRNRAEEIIQQCRFLLHLIKPAHVLADIRVYEKDIFGKPLQWYTNSNQEDLYLAVDEVVTQKFIHHSYDDFRKYTRNETDTRVMEFNNISTVMNKISETYGDIGYYLNEADPLYKKKYSLFQLKGNSSQSSSLLNTPASLEFNEAQTSLFNNVSSFNQTLKNKTVNFPEIEINEDLPVRDYVVSEDEVKVSALTLDLGVEVSAGTIYSYQQAAIVTLSSPITLVLPEEVTGERVFIYIDLSGEDPVVAYKISDEGLYDVEVPSIALAQIDVPSGATIIWDMDIVDLRLYSFINLTLTGDPSGFSRFNVNRGIVLGAGTRPIHYRYDANQSDEIYKVENLSELCNTSFDLNENFILGEETTGYIADDLHFLYSDIETTVQEASFGSIPTPCFEGALVLGVVFGPESENDRVRIFDEDTVFIFNDTLPRVEQIPVVDAESPVAINFDGILENSFRLYNTTTSSFLLSGTNFTLDIEDKTLTFLAGVSDGDILLAYFYQPFGTLFNEDLLYGNNTTYASFDFNTFSADSIELAEESASVGVTQVVPEYFGVPVTGLLFNTASLTTGTVTGLAFPTGTQLILNSFSTNLAQYSEAFNSWSTYGTVTTTTNATADPNGDLTAERLVWGSTGYNGKYQNIPVTSGSSYVFSVWVKRIATTNPIGLFIVDNNGATVYGSTLVTPTTSWVRYSVTGTITGTGTSVTARIVNRSTSPYSADIYVWGAQFETGTTVSAYTKTNSTGSVVSLLNQPAQEVVSPVVYFNESAPSLINLEPLGPIEQLALEGVSIIDQSTGLPVIAFDGNPVT